MSRWWTPRQALLEPGRATLDGATRATGAGWTGALAALDALLAERAPAGRAAWPRPRLRLVLSNHFVRYLVLPADPAIRGEAERDAWLAHHFAAVYGERARAWAFTAQRNDASTLLAAAVDKGLLEESRSIAGRRGHALRGAQPLAVHVLNRSTDATNEERFLAVVESQRVCLLLVQGDRVLRIANQRCADARADLPSIVALEALDAGFEPARRPPLSVVDAAAPVAAARA